MANVSILEIKLVGDDHDRKAYSNIQRQNKARIHMISHLSLGASLVLILSWTMGQRVRLKDP